MAKEIKAIKCPQCGSTAKVEVKPDVYRCANCQTEYYLDDDDVTVNYNHNHRYSYDANNGNQPLAPQTTKTLMIIGAVVFAVIFVSIISNVLFNKAPVASNYVVSEAKEIEKEYDSNISRIYALAQPELAKPIVIKVENRRYNAEKDKPKDGYYFGFYDALADKPFAVQKMEEVNYTGGELKTKQFADGQTYMIMDGELYRVDLVKGKLDNVGKTFFAGHKELQVGIATISFVYDDFGDGLIIMTNDGQKFYLYPLVKKLYTEDEFYDAQTGFGSLLPGAKEMTMYTFTGKSNDYPKEKRQLLKVRYKDNGGGPKDLLDNVSWGKDYGGSGIFTERDPYTKVLVGPYEKQRSRVLDWKDLTPGRYYFNPEMLYGKGNQLLIQFVADANPKSDYLLQQLDTETGKPLWTISPPAIIRELTPYKSGYVAVTRTDSVIIMDLKGHIRH
jgi:hypothetical protein